MIELKNVSIKIGPKLLIDQAFMACAAGTLTALVGPNGAGKSTLLSAIAGDIEPVNGQIVLAGKPLNTYTTRELAQLRSVFPQSAILRFAYKVEDVVAMGRTFRDLPPHEDARAISEAIAAAEIAHLRQRDAMTLSGGENARTTLARILAQDTPIVLLDEPTAALDLRHQERVLRIAKDLAASGKTVVAVLHDLNLAASYADQVVLLANGQIIAAGRPPDVLCQERIETVYRQPVRVIQHPTRGCPVILTV